MHFPSQNQKKTNAYEQKDAPKKSTMETIIELIDTSNGNWGWMESAYIYESVRGGVSEGKRTMNR